MPTITQERPAPATLAAPHRYSASQRIAASPEALFARLDDQTRLGEHMTKPSAMMGGGGMTFEFDAGRGMAVGSRIRMGGSAFGLTMLVEEEVAEREPPCRKVWRTIGTPQLLIIGSYAMGFDIAPASGGSDLAVWIEYELPNGWFGRLLGWLFASFYARWCVGRMVSDAVDTFSGVKTGEPAA